MQIADTTIDNFLSATKDSLSVLFEKEMCVCGALATMEQKEADVGGRWQVFFGEEKGTGKDAKCGARGTTAGYNCPLLQLRRRQQEKGAKKGLR